MAIDRKLTRGRTEEAPASGASCWDPVMKKHFIAKQQGFCLLKLKASGIVAGCVWHVERSAHRKAWGREEGFPKPSVSQDRSYLHVSAVTSQKGFFSFPFGKLLLLSENSVTFPAGKYYTEHTSEI